jgi:hypothetical protein
LPAATGVASIRTLVSRGGMYLGAENKQLPGVLNRFRGYPELGFGSSHVADLKAHFADVRIRSTYGLIASIVATA